MSPSSIRPWTWKPWASGRWRKRLGRRARHPLVHEPHLPAQSGFRLVRPRSSGSKQRCGTALRQLRIPHRLRRRTGAYLTSSLFSPMFEFPDHGPAPGKWLRRCWRKCSPPPSRRRRRPHSRRRPPPAWWLKAGSAGEPARLLRRPAAARRQVLTASSLEGRIDIRLTRAWRSAVTDVEISFFPAPARPEAHGRPFAGRGRRLGRADLQPLRQGPESGRPGRLRSRAVPAPPPGTFAQAAGTQGAGGTGPGTRLAPTC
jgi:hypothetical protein